MVAAFVVVLLLLTTAGCLYWAHKVFIGKFGWVSDVGNAVSIGLLALLVMLALPTCILSDRRVSDDLRL